MGPRALLEQYRRASALCMPCRLLPDDRDGIPNVLVEAMAAGTPVVATAVSGIPELVTDGVNGLLVDPEQPEQLADALLRLHADAGLAERLRSAARTTVAERFDGDRLARRARRPLRGVDVLTARIAAPRPVLCVTAHEHCDRARAEAVAAGCFAFGGETRELGTEPDWLHADLPDDEEWRIDWVKFAYGLDLAHAHAATGDARFRDAWERLARSWIRTVPPDHDAAEVTARRILNWVYAWQAFGELSPSSPHGWSGASASRWLTCARTSRPSATIARSSCTRS